MSKRHYEAFQPLITPAEAVRLAWREVTVSEAQFAKEIAEAWKANGYPEPITPYTFLLCANLFEAGRIQGIREERRRRAASRNQDKGGKHDGAYTTAEGRADQKGADGPEE